jgi:hypothetical protein
VVVDVVVEVDVDVDVVGPITVVVVDVVADVPTIGSVMEFVHNPFETTFINVAALGTLYDVYPAVNAAFVMFTSKGAVNPSASEYKSKGPVSVPAIVNVIITVCAIVVKLLIKDVRNLS